MYPVCLSFFLTISSTSRGSPTQVDKDDLELLIFPSLPPHCWAYRRMRLHPLYTGCWESNLVLPACLASTLPTELHSQPHSSFYNEHLQRVHMGRNTILQIWRSQLRVPFLQLFTPLVRARLNAGCPAHGRS